MGAVVGAAAGGGARTLAGGANEGALATKVGVAATGAGV